MNVYEVPTTVRLSVQFSLVSTNTPTDPSAVTLLLTRPDSGGVEESHPDPIRDSVGAYHWDLDVDQRGYWRYRWHGEGGAVVTSHYGRLKGI